MRNRTQVDAALLAAPTVLKVVGRLGVGLDNIDVAACEARGVAVIPATGANALAVAEYVIGTAMLLLRGAYRSTTRSPMARGRGRRWATAARSPARRSASSASAASAASTGGLARALGMRTIGFDAQLGVARPSGPRSEARPRALAELLAEADVVIAARAADRRDAQPDRRRAPRAR